MGGRPGGIGRRWGTGGRPGGKCFTPSNVLYTVMYVLILGILRHLDGGWVVVSYG